MNDLREDLLAIQTETRKIARFTQDGEASFWADDRIQYAVMMAYTRIGQLLKQIPEELLANQPQVPWAAIKGFRDVLAHQYHTINLERVWGAVEALPALQDAVDALLAALPPETGSEQ